MRFVPAFDFGAAVEGIELAKRSQRADATLEDNLLNSDLTRQNTQQQMEQNATLFPLQQQKLQTQVALGQGTLAANIATPGLANLQTQANTVGTGLANEQRDLMNQNIRRNALVDEAGLPGRIAGAQVGSALAGTVQNLMDPDTINQIANNRVQTMVANGQATRVEAEALVARQPDIVAAKANLASADRTNSEGVVGRVGTVNAAQDALVKAGYTDAMATADRAPEVAAANMQKAIYDTGYASARAQLLPAMVQSDAGRFVVEAELNQLKIKMQEQVAERANPAAIQNYAQRFGKSVAEVQAIMDGNISATSDQMDIRTGHLQRVKTATDERNEQIKAGRAKDIGGAAGAVGSNPLVGGAKPTTAPAAPPALIKPAEGTPAAAALPPALISKIEPQVRQIGEIDNNIRNLEKEVKDAETVSGTLSREMQIQMAQKIGAKREELINLREQRSALDRARRKEILLFERDNKSNAENEAKARAFLGAK